MSPSVDRRAVLAVIALHEGIDNPITTKALARSLGGEWPRDWPIIRQAVDALLDEGHPIGSTASRGESGGGYFMCKQYRDFKEVLDQYDTRLRKLHRRADTLRRMMPQNPQGTLL